MTDVIFLALIVGFFALAVGLVKLCERIVGGADVAVLESPEAPGPAPVGQPPSDQAPTDQAGVAA